MCSDDNCGPQLSTVQQYSEDCAERNSGLQSQLDLLKKRACDTRQVVGALVMSKGHKLFVQ